MTDAANSMNRNLPGNLLLSIERMIQGTKMEKRNNGYAGEQEVPSPEIMVSADILEDLKGANFSSKSLLDTLDGVKAQICERQLAYRDVMNALQNGTMNGLGPPPSELQGYASVLVNQTNEMNQQAESLRVDTVGALRQTYSLAKDACLSLINGDLYNWKVKQKKAQLRPRHQAEAINAELDLMEPCFEILGSELRRLVHHIALMEKDFSQSGCQQRSDEIKTLRSSANKVIEDFTKQSVVITQQPPSYLMKTRQPTGGGSGNRATGRHPCMPALRVLGGQIMACGAIQRRNTVGEVKCVLISEEQARCINSGHSMDGEDKRVGTLLHNTAVFEMPINTKIYCAEFKRPLQLVSIDRPTDEQETIPRQRYYLAFLVKLPFVSQPFWKLSLPVAALVHPRQARDQGADAYMFWEYAFSHGDGVLTYVPRENSEGVAWRELGEALKLKFMQLIEGPKKDQAAQFTLTEENLNHIASRLFGAQADYSQCRVTWEAFFQHGLEGLRRENDDTPVPFWEWFYKNAEIIQKHLLCQWNKGLIYGFCSKKRSESLLASRQNSTLMVKFSDTQFGSLIISYRNPSCGVQHLRIKADDLTRVPSENCMLDIQDLRNIEYIYPENPVAEFRPEKRPERTGRKSPTDKQNQGITDPYFTNVVVGFRAEGGGMATVTQVQMEWPIPAPPQNWEDLDIFCRENLDFDDLIRDIEMNEPVEDEFLSQSSRI